MKKAVKIQMFGRKVTCYACATGIKVKSSGRVMTTPAEVSEVLASLSKSDARRVRKMLRQAGLTGLSGVAAAT